MQIRWALQNRTARKDANGVSCTRLERPHHSRCQWAGAEELLREGDGPRAYAPLLPPAWSTSESFMSPGQPTTDAWAPSKLQNRQGPGPRDSVWQGMHQRGRTLRNSCTGSLMLQVETGTSQVEVPNQKDWLEPAG